MTASLLRHDRHAARSSQWGMNRQLAVRRTAGQTPGKTLAVMREVVIPTLDCGAIFLNRASAAPRISLTKAEAASPGGGIARDGNRRANSLPVLVAPPHFLARQAADLARIFARGPQPRSSAPTRST
jgi:hypothetical protein